MLPARAAGFEEELDSWMYPISSALTSKHLVLAVTGSISAYKSLHLLRELQRLGADVTPIMTEDAKRFVGPISFEALSGKRIPKDLWSGDEPLVHTVLGKSADLVLVAPATASTIGKAAAGIADDLVSAVILSTSAPVVMVPAMHAEMWENAATRHNVELLRSRAVTVMEPGWGELAGFDEGPGRFPDTEDVVALVELVLEKAATGSLSVAGKTPDKELSGVSVTVTAGGTREPVDAVRYLGNRSSGKMGHALAKEAWLRGAQVTLVTTVPLPIKRHGIDEVVVETAEEMRNAVIQAVRSSDVVVMAAAVADFRPKERVGHKIKREDGLESISLERTPDILEEVSSMRNEGEIKAELVVGFAAETEEVESRALSKLERKLLDVIVANDVSKEGSGFGWDTNQASIISRDGSVVKLPLMSKRALARVVWDHLAGLLKEARS